MLKKKNKTKTTTHKFTAQNMYEGATQPSYFTTERKDIPFDELAQIEALLCGSCPKK